MSNASKNGFSPLHLVLHWYSTHTEIRVRRGLKNKADLDPSPVCAPGGKEGAGGKQGPLLHPLSIAHTPLFLPRCHFLPCLCEGQHGETFIHFSSVYLMNLHSHTLALCITHNF